MTVDESLTDNAIRARKLLTYAKENRANRSRLELNLQDIIWRAIGPYRLSYATQPVILGFIPDFAIKRLKLLIEADGPHHAQQLDYDAWRDKKLRDAGYSVLRFTQQEINLHPENVESRIKFIVAMLHNKCAKKYREKQNFKN